MHSRWLAVLILCAVFPLYAHTAEFDAEYAERLIWAGRFQEAAQYLQPRARAETLEGARLLCLLNALWGRNDHAIYHCGRATPFWYMTLDKMPEILAMLALAEWRSGDYIAGGKSLRLALDMEKPPGWLLQMVDIAIVTEPDQQLDKLLTLCNRVEAPQVPALVTISYTHMGNEADCAWKHLRCPA